MVKLCVVHIVKSCLYTVELRFLTVIYLFLHKGTTTPLMTI